MDGFQPSRQYPGMIEEPKSVLQSRLAERLELLKLKPAPLAKTLGLSDSFIRDILRGKTKSPRADSFEKLAAALETTADYLLGKTDSPSILAPAVAISGPRPVFAGDVQAGRFLAVDEFNQDPDGVPEWVLSQPQYAQVRQYAWRARGDSMDKAGIHDGMWIVGADAADFIDRYGDIESGELVVVERTRFQGAERELTVKEVRFYRDRYELHPNSSNPEHKPIIVPHDHSVSGDGEEVKIIGVVLTAYTNLRRRR